VIEKDMENTTKICSSCKQEKPVTEYYKWTRSRDGLTAGCKTCKSLRGKAHYQENREILIEKSRAWEVANPDRARERKRQWAVKHPEGNIAWANAHPEQVKEKGDRWRKANPEKVAAYKATAYQKPEVKISMALSGNIRNHIARGSKTGRRWEGLVGYTVDQLKAHLEKGFKSGMTWDNYGPYWHIDHKIPVSAFNFSTPDDIDFKRCWSLNNLQPLEARLNEQKGNRLDKPFQPSLSIGVA
jgi:5-methylcytosine-specific restriction endonuclease McrA